MEYGVFGEEDGGRVLRLLLLGRRREDFVLRLAPSIVKSKAKAAAQRLSNA